MPSLPRRFIGLAFTLLLPSALFAAPAPEQSSSVSFPDGVADAAGKTAYVANAAGGIDAIDLA